MLNTLLFLTLTINSYQPDDFHYYDSNLQPRGFNLVNKVYIEIYDNKEIEKFTGLKSLEGLNHFKNIKTNELNGIIAEFGSKKIALEALNHLLKKGFKAYPVVLFNEIESTTNNTFFVNVHPSVNKEDFLKRLNNVVNGKFSILAEPQQKTFIIKADGLVAPANIIILTNLIAKDSVWVKSAGVNWIPVDIGVKATAIVETSSFTHLGETRKLKLTIDIVDPKIKLRTDILPVFGQGLVPFPNPGDIWLDSFSPNIIEFEDNGRRTVVIDYVFRQLMHGNFLFQPIILSYEKNGILNTVRTDACRYSIKSVIEGTDISDIQARTDDGLQLSKTPIGLTFTSEPPFNIKFYLSGFLLIVGALFICIAIVNGGNRICNWWLDVENAEINKLWLDLKRCSALEYREHWRTNYAYVTMSLNKVLVEVFGISLYNIDVNKCNNHFLALISELQKMYTSTDSGVKPDSVKLVENLDWFCRERKYD